MVFHGENVSFQQSIKLVKRPAMVSNDRTSPQDGFVVAQEIVGREVVKESRQLVDVVFLLQRFAHALNLLGTEAQIFLVHFHVDFPARSKRWLKEILIVLVFIILVEGVKRVVRIEVRIILSLQRVRLVDAVVILVHLQMVVLNVGGRLMRF